MTYNFNHLKVPEQWVYEHYLKLPEKLEGQRIRISSVFNDEKTPSMFVYYHKDKYLWYDHSSGMGGDVIDLMRELMIKRIKERLSYPQITRILRHDFRDWEIRNGKYKDSEIDAKYHAYDLFCRYEARGFGGLDSYYWLEYGINVPLLQQYHARPLKYWQLGKRHEGNVVWNRETYIPYSYGIFNSHEALQKIYNPFYSELKHINLINDIVGRDQLRGGKTLVICSSFKDMLSLKATTLDLDVLAPMSEKTIIPANIMNDLKNMYRDIFVIFDNDKTGVKAMVMYKQLYGLDYVYVPFEKDLAEFRKTHGFDKFKEELTIRINKKFPNTNFDEIEKTWNIKNGWKPVEGWEDSWPEDTGYKKTYPQDEATTEHLSTPIGSTDWDKQKTFQEGGTGAESRHPH